MIAGVNLDQRPHSATALLDSGAEALGLIGAPVGSLRGIPVIDCTNAVDYATGELKPESGSAAELVASIAPNAHV